jgi:hypothetical protein
VVRNERFELVDLQKDALPPMDHAATGDIGRALRACFVGQVVCFSVNRSLRTWRLTSVTVVRSSRRMNP